MRWAVGTRGALEIGTPRASNPCGQENNHGSSRRVDAELAAADEPAAKTISFIHKLAASDAFKSLFKEGMTLVEEAAAYLDGPGRQESRQLRRPVALAYATESMRLTTRLMQVASWLLLQRAVNEGELTTAQALSEKHRVRLAEQDIACGADLFEELPRPCANSA